MTPTTNRQTVLNLCKSILNRLENRKMIEFSPRLRSNIHDEMNSLIGPHVLTEEDIKEKAMNMMGASVDSLQDSQFTESEQFRTAKRMIRKDLGENELNGLYFVRTIKELSEALLGYFMNSQHIDEVYESDDEIQKEIVGVVKRFNPDNLH